MNHLLTFPWQALTGPAAEWEPPSDLGKPWLAVPEAPLSVWKFSPHLPSHSPLSSTGDHIKKNAECVHF